MSETWTTRDYFKEACPRLSDLTPCSQNSRDCHRKLEKILRFSNFQYLGTMFQIVYPDKRI